VQIAQSCIMHLGCGNNVHQRSSHLADCIITTRGPTEFQRQVIGG